MKFFKGKGRLVTEATSHFLISAYSQDISQISTNPF